MEDSKIIRQIKERIIQYKKDGKKLDLDCISIRNFTKQIKKMVQSCSDIEYLTLNDCQITSLNNFPILQKLSTLQLSHNKIQDNELFHLLRNSHISCLMLDQNLLKNVQKISVLRQLPLLQHLEIGGNCIQTQFYWDQIFQKIPHLQILNCKNKSGEIVVFSDCQSDNKSQCSIQNMKPQKRQNNQKSTLNKLQQQKNTKNQNILLTKQSKSKKNLSQCSQNQQDDYTLQWQSSKKKTKRINSFD